MLDGKLLQDAIVGLAFALDNGFAARHHIVFVHLARITLQRAFVRHVDHRQRADHLIADIGLRIGILSQPHVLGVGHIELVAVRADGQRGRVPAGRNTAMRLVALCAGFFLGELPGFFLLVLFQFDHDHRVLAGVQHIQGFTVRRNGEGVRRAAVGRVLVGAHVDLEQHAVRRRVEYRYAVAVGVRHKQSVAAGAENHRVRMPAHRHMLHDLRGIGVLHIHHGDVFFFPVRDVQLFAIRARQHRIREHAGVVWVFARAHRNPVRHLACQRVDHGHVAALMVRDEQTAFVGGKRHAGDEAAFTARGDLDLPDFRESGRRHLIFAHHIGVPARGVNALSILAEHHTDEKPVRRVVGNRALNRQSLAVDQHQRLLAVAVVADQNVFAVRAQRHAERNHAHADFFSRRCELPIVGSDTGLAVGAGAGGTGKHVIARCTGACDRGGGKDAGNERGKERCS